MRIFICLTLIPLTQINVPKKYLHIRLRKGIINNKNLIKKHLFRRRVVNICQANDKSA